MSDSNDKRIPAGAMPHELTEVIARAPRIIKGRFQVETDPTSGREHVIGQGGFGTTYLVYDLMFRRRAVLKTLLRQWADKPEYRKRFELEALALSRIQHPAVVQAYVTDEDEDGTPFFVMEYAEGEGLARILATRGRLPQDEVRELGIQLCEALAAAHAKGILHRDLKPLNLVVGRDATGRAQLKVLDFGIATVLQGEAETALGELKPTEAGGSTAIGTFEYMSPEHLLGDELDARTDVYSAGVVLYQLLTGRHPKPRPSSTTRAAIERYVDKPFVPLTPDEASPQLASVLAQALQTDRSRRFASATLMADALRAAPTGPVSAHPKSRLSRVVAGLVLAVVALGVVIALRPVGAPHPESPDQRSTRDAAGATAPSTGAPLPQAAIVPAPERARSAAGGTVAAANGGNVSPAPRTNIPAPAKVAKETLRPSTPIPEFMAAFAAGAAVVGCEETACATDEKPAIAPVLTAFRLDRNEVTSAAFAQCVAAGVCPPPADKPGCTAADPNEPVRCVSWSQAEAFCRWRGARLPSEFEWERAARGVEGREFPWGSDPATCARATLKDAAGKGCGAGGPAPVGSRAGGASPEGIHDLAGNVWEWTADAYSETTYAEGRPPKSGPNRVVRGGSFENPAAKLSSHYRMSFRADGAFPNVGFRCAR